MAIKKNSSRFTDRNKIRKMNAEGYSVQQIADTVSITPEHVNYVLTQWDAVEEKLKDTAKQKERDAMEAARQKAIPETPVPTIDDAERERIRAQARAEYIAEQEAAAKEVVEEIKPKRRPRKKKVVENEFDDEPIPNMG